MVLRPARLAVCASLLLVPAARGLADDPKAVAPARRSPENTPQTQGAVAPPTSPAAPAAVPTPPQPRTEVDAKQARAEAEGRIKGLPVQEADLTPAQKALRDVWNERLAMIDEWLKSLAERSTAAKPEVSPEREVAEHHAEIEQRTAFLAELAAHPDAVLPELFRLAPDQIDETKLAEMGRAIDDRRQALADRTSDLEKNRARPAEHASAIHDLGVERDKAHARKTTLAARRPSVEAAYTSAATEEARRLAREKLINYRWSVALAEERLSVVESRLASETKRGEAAELAIKSGELQVKAIQSLLEALSRRYAEIADRRKLALRTEAAREKARAAATDDPIVKFSARRSAEIHEIEVQLVEYERLLSATPKLSCEEQKALADHAEADLASIKQVINEGHTGGLIALRLNNDFRRLSRERGMIQRNELAQAAALNAHYENALAETELAIINDARDDQYERDAFLETLPAAMRPRAIEQIEALEVKHRDLLARKKVVLERLLDRAEKTHIQVARRLHILEEQYAFIRTQLFWVRDAEPIGPGVIDQARRDGAKVAAAAALLLAEPLDRKNWTPISAEFGLVVAALVLLPPAIVYARRRLKARIAAPAAGALIIRMD